MSDEKIGITKYLSATEMSEDIWEELDDLTPGEATCIVRGVGHSSAVVISKEFYLDLYLAWKKEISEEPPEPGSQKSKHEVEKWLVKEMSQRVLPCFKKDWHFYTDSERSRIEKLKRDILRRAKQLKVALEKGEEKGEDNV